MARPKLTPVSVEKTCPTCNKMFTVEYRLRNRRTYCSKSCANHDPAVISKMIASQNKTYSEKYGKHPMQTDGTKENFKQAMRKKYGVEWFSKSKDWKLKVNETNMERHGSEWFTNPEQTKKTCMERYGVTNYRQTEEYEKKYKMTCLEKYGVDHASKHEKFRTTHYETMFDRFLNHPRFSNFSPLFSFDEYEGVFSKKYPFKCKRCGVQGEYSIEDGKFPICPDCDKLNSSFFQKEVYDYIKLLVGDGTSIILNDRTILHPKEIDIVIPSHKLAIECDGLVWHSEIIGGKNKIYHLLKTRNAIIRGYNLIHIFDCEWENKKDIVKSVLSILLEKCSNKIYARNCHVEEILPSKSTEFLDANHLQGADHSSVKLGLIYNDKLVSMMTFVKSRFDLNAQWEMSRYCNERNIVIPGGASKLFSHFLKTHNPVSIVSYNDRRYFNGMLYLKMGFRFVHNSPPNYHYIIDNYLNIQSRIAWQKHKLEGKLDKFDPNLSEWENMKNNGFDRIWDCGHGKWIWNGKKSDV